MRARLLSMTAVEVRPGGEDRLNRWYDERHMPDHVACPGFVRGARYESLGRGPRYLSAYDIESAAAFTGDEVRAAGAEGWGEVLPLLDGVMSRRFEHAFSLDHPDRPREADVAPYLAWIVADARPDQETAFTSWLDEDFAPSVVAHPGVRGLSRYLCVGAEPRHLVLVEAGDAAAADAARVGERVADLRTLAQGSYRAIFSVRHGDAR